VVRAKLQEITALWQRYTSQNRLPDLIVPIREFDDRLQTLLHGSIEPSLDLARQGKSAELDQLFQQRSPALFQAAFDADTGLVARQIQVGQTAYLSAVADLRSRLTIGIGTSLAGLVMVLALGWRLYLGVKRPVRSLEGHLRAITNGEIDLSVITTDVLEFRGAIAMMRAMRAHLAFAGWLKNESERKAELIRRETVEQMAQKIETEAVPA
jgi:hypothetical protein